MYENERMEMLEDRMNAHLTDIRVEIKKLGEWKEQMDLRIKHINQIAIELQKSLEGKEGGKD